MRKYQVEITKIAGSDIQEIFKYILRDNKRAAIKWVEEIERQIDRLGNFPMRCPIISEAEGIQFNPGWGPKEVVLDEKGSIKGLLCMKVKSVFDEQGRFRPTFHQENETFLKGDMIIEAIGQAPDFSFIPEKLFKKLEFTERKKVKVNENGMTSIPRVFAGGDIVNLDAVTAIADAKSAAEGIVLYLRQNKGKGK